MIHSLLDWFAFQFVRLTAWVVQRLSTESAFRVGRTLGTCLSIFLVKGRRIAYANLKKAFPESTVRERKRWMEEMFQHLGISGVEVLRFPALTREEIEKHVTHHGYDPYVEKRRKGQGVILLTAHMGNWEYSQIIEGLQGRPLTVLARRQKFRRLDQLLNSFRQYYGSVSIAKGAGIRDLIRILRKGGCVGMLGDQSGGEEGVWVRFFGRLAPSPRGPMALALKFNLTVFPVFCVRGTGPYHDIFLESSFQLVRTGDRELDIQINTQNFMNRLESYLRKYPGQWLWGHKRWKRTRTMRITILSDGKPGHVKQSEALVKELCGVGSRKFPAYEMPVEKIEVRFKSQWHKFLFSLFSIAFIPWAQTRLHWLHLFLDRASAERIERSIPDAVVSAGASLAALNLCMVRENLAKSVILMKPNFPFNFFRYDLALVPAHDRGVLPREHCRIQGALGAVDEGILETSKKTLAGSLKEPEKVRLSLFLGGETHRFKPSVADVQTLLAELERAGEKLGGDYLITTSRRTPEAIVRFLQSETPRHPRCQLLVVASEDRRPEVVPGMMALAEFLVVTEDSLSMISEALSSGKRVIVVKMGTNGLPRKHSRFQENLKKEWGVPVVDAGRLSEIFGNGELRTFRHQFDAERARIQERLEALL